MRRIGVSLMMAVALLAGAMPAASAGVLERVRAEGVLRCGVLSSGEGLAVEGADGQWRGFFPDFCRAVAAAVTGRVENLEMVEINPLNRLEMTRSGKVDLTVAGTTWTLNREATLGIEFPAVMMFDGQGIMAHRSLGVERLADLKGGRVCAIEGTTSIRNIEQWAQRRRIALTIRPVQTFEGAISAFFNHHCDLFTNDRIGLFAQRLRNAPKPDDYVVFPDMIAKEPLSIAIPAGDPHWYRIVRWVFLATVLAEEKGISSANVTTQDHDPDPEVRRLLGITPGVGAGLDLDDGWAMRVLTQVGNYGEIWDRHLGRGSPLRIDRGLNELWLKGGLMYAPPLGG